MSEGIPGEVERRGEGGEERRGRERRAHTHTHTLVHCPAVCPYTHMFVLYKHTLSLTHTHTKLLPYISQLH